MMLERNQSVEILRELGNIIQPQILNFIMIREPIDLS